MNKQIPFLMALATSISVAGPVEAAPLLVLTEADRTDATRSVSAEYQPVDINSTVKVRLVGDAIRKHFEGDTGQRSSILQSIVDLERPLSEAAGSVSTYVAGIKSAWIDMHSPDATLRADALRRSNENIAALGRLVRDVSKLALNDPNLSREYKRSLGNPITQNLLNGGAQFIVEATRKELRRLQSQLQESAASNSVQLSATLYHSGRPVPIHVPGFDTNAVRSYSEVSRWAIGLDEQGRRELQRNAAIAKEAREANPSQTIFQTVLMPALASIQPRLSTLAKSLKTASQVAVKDSNLAAAYDAAAKLDVEVRSDQAAFEHLRNGAGVTGADLLLAIDSYQRSLSTLAGDLLAKLDKIDTSKLKAANKPLDIEQLRSDISSVQSLLNQAGVVRSIEDASRNELTNQNLLSRDINELPEATEIALETAEGREPDDLIVLRLARIRDSQPPEDLEVTRFRVERVLAHFETLSSLVISPNPNRAVSSTGASPSVFLLSPSISVLLKGGVAHDSWLWAPFSNFWNDVLTPGIGVNVAAIDVTSGKPDIAVGPILSVFRDLVQVGYQWDLYLNMPSLFFGFRLPLSNPFTSPALAVSLSQQGDAKPGTSQ